MRINISDKVLGTVALAIPAIGYCAGGQLVTSLTYAGLTFVIGKIGFDVLTKKISKSIANEVEIALKEKTFLPVRTRKAVGQKVNNAVYRILNKIDELPEASENTRLVTGLIKIGTNNFLNININEIVKKNVKELPLCSGVLGDRIISWIHKDAVPGVAEAISQIILEETEETASTLTQMYNAAQSVSEFGASVWKDGMKGAFSYLFSPNAA